MNTAEKTIALGQEGVSESIGVRRPKVLLVASSGASGEEPARKVRVLAESLARDGWEVRLQVGETAVVPESRRRSGIPHPKYGLGCLGRLVRLFPRFDIVHVLIHSAASFWLFAVPVMVLARFFGRKVVLGFASVRAEDFLDRWSRAACPFFRMADRLMVDSEYLLPFFTRVGLKADSIAAPFDRSGLEYREAGPIQPRILADRPLEAASNLACLIKAFKFVKQKYPRSELMIAGDGSRRQALESLVRRENTNGVTFVGNVSRKERLSLYRQADLYANSSSLDGLPESILTAFAAGLPVVTTDAGGIPYLVTDRVNGLVVPVNNHVALAERVIELVENPDLVRSLAERGRAELERFHWQTLGVSWRQYYRSLMTG